MRQRVTIISAYPLEEARKLVALAAATPDLRTGQRSTLAGEVSEDRVCLYRRLEAPESHVKFHGALRADGGKVVLDGVYATERYEGAMFVAIASLLAIAAVLVAAFSLKRGSVASVLSGSLASIALLILGYRVLRFHRNTFRREAESLGEILRNVLGDDAAP